MLVPYRLQVIRKLKTLLELPLDVQGPLAINGPTIELLGKVTTGRNILGDETPAPALAILEAPRPDFANYAGEEWSHRADSLTLMIQGRVQNDVLNPSDNAYYFAAAVEQRLSWIIAENRGLGKPVYPDHYMLGNLITKLEVAPPVVRPPEDKLSPLAFFFLIIRLGIAMEYGKPYTDVL